MHCGLRLVLLLGIGAITSLSLSSCSNGINSNIASAQACLNTASPSTVSTCTAMLNGDTSTAAYSIRCSAHYIANGFTTTRFATAFQSISAGSGGNNGASTFESALGFLIFSSTSGTDGSTQTMSDCSAAGQSSLYDIALLTATGTAITTATGASITPAADGSISAAQLKAAAAAFSGSPATLGNLAISANSNFCATGSSFSGNSICTQLNSAISAGGTSGNASAIGTQLLTLLQQ